MNCVVFYLFYTPVSSIVWLVLMMFTAVLSLLCCGLLGHLLSFHIYLSKYKNYSSHYSSHVCVCVCVC